MKKTYKTPTTFIVKTQIQHHLCTASEKISTATYSGGSIESRRGGSSWDEDEEEY